MHQRLKDTLGFPDYYGHSWDALLMFLQDILTIQIYQIKRSSQTPLRIAIAVFKCYLNFSEEQQINIQSLDLQRKIKQRRALQPILGRKARLFSQQLG